MSRDPLGIQQDNNGFLYAIDPLGSLVANTQPPSGGPPPYIPVYGATYGGVTWNLFINANNFSGGCYSAENSNPALCNDMARELARDRLNGDFWSNLPGFHEDLLAGENAHLTNVHIASRHIDPLDEMVAVLRGTEWVRRTTPQAPQDPTPQPQQPQRLPFNSCEEFVRWLGNLTTGALLNGHIKKYSERLTARVFGSDLAEIAYFQYDRHINNGFAGFRPELVNAGQDTPQGPQGAGVYGHILLNAGLRLIEQSGDPGGAVGFHMNRFKDWGQAVLGSPQFNRKGLAT